MSIAPDNVVRRIVTDAELLLWAVAEADLPAGLRIIDIGLAPIDGMAIWSGHRLAAAHRLRPGTVAVGVAAQALVGEALTLCPDEAQLVVEAVTAHELAHALVADIEGEADEATLAVLRDLPTLLADALPAASAPARMARDHGPRWARALVALGQRCAGIRRLSRSAWASVIEADLRQYGIDADAVADALGDIAAEASLRELLAEGGPVAERLALAVAARLGLALCHALAKRLPRREPQFARVAHTLALPRNALAAPLARGQRLPHGVAVGEPLRASHA
jgi:hypothetical protein